MAIRKNTETDTETKDITQTFGGSPVSSNASEAAETEIDLSKAKITIPNTATGEAPATTPPTLAEFTQSDNTFEQRLLDTSLGLIRVDGGFTYIGQSPAIDPAELATGIKVTTGNSTFTPLADVPFTSAWRVKIGDVFFYPTSASGWADVELDGVPLVPREANRKATKARYDAKHG